MSPIEIDGETKVAVQIKSNILHSTARVIILLFCVSLLIPFQNCSVYKSDGRDEFNSNLARAEDKGCYPYIDTNIAMEFLGITNDSLNVYKSQASLEDGTVCDFRAAGHSLNHINCKVSRGNAEQVFLLKLNGETAFPGIVATWLAPSTGIVPGLVGGNHGGFITLDNDGKYTVKYLALDGSEQKGVGCAVRLDATAYNTALSLTQAKDTVSKLAYEMAINNQQ